MQAKQDIFPFSTVLSLKHLIAFWQGLAEDASSLRAVQARAILDRLDQAPKLAGTITDLTLLEQHVDLLDLMMGAIFSPALWDEALMAATLPFSMKPFYATPGFREKRIFKRGTPQMARSFFGGEEGLATARTLHAFYNILESHYGTALPHTYPLLFCLPDEATGLDAYYKIEINKRFVSIEAEGDLPELSPQDIEQLMANPFDLALWTEKLPPELFAFHGFLVLTATEVTDQAVLSRLKDDLLAQGAMASPDRIDVLQRRLRSLLRQPDLDLGLICLERDDIEGITAARGVGRSLLLGDSGAPACPYMDKSFYARAFERSEPLIVNDLTSCDVCTGFEKYLRGQDYRTLVLAPLRVKGKLIGLLELASPSPNAVSTLMSVQLAEAVSLFALAMKRMLDEREDHLQAVIKEHFTAIHPSVEWRFRHAAQRFLDSQGNGRTMQMEAPVFPNVYPLYGLSDIRGSSTRRGDAIRADLLEQLGLALSVIVEASINRHLPILDEISFRISRYAEGMGPDASAEDETNVLDFLQQDVEPLFEQLASFGSTVQKRIQEYRDALDSKLGVLYRQRKDFEESVTMINDTISAFLDAQEEQAQAMFPHYFEKFKTDGVDYNIYVGASLVEDGTFDPLYLRNLRLWQLLTMCRIEWTLRRLKPKLPTPLDATHLVLVQNTPLSIRFRMEEKQFDVDGAYNIRYEIVKKRIDKALIHDTGERLTQPGQIAIVYSQAREAAEYHRYLEYLRAAGYITGEIEDLELEPMQGVHGLKALRVTIHDEEPSAGDDATPLPEVRRILEAAGSKLGG